MVFLSTLFVLLLLLAGEKIAATASDEATEPAAERPLIYLAILARNAVHLLPNYLGYIERLNYPKQRIIVGILTDHNVDNTSGLLSEWSQNTQSLYHAVYYSEDDNPFTLNDTEPFTWGVSRLQYMCQLRQRILEHARELAVDYLFFVDCDNFLINPETLNRLLETNKPIVAPLLMFGKDKAFTNFWGGQNEHGYYVRTPEYIPIVSRKKQGCFKVPLVHSTFLLDLRTVASQSLAYWPPPATYEWSIDDIIIFSYSARINGIGMYVLNTEVFGYLLKADQYQTLEDAVKGTVNWKLKTIVNHSPVPVSQYLSLPDSTADRVGTDAIFLISLERRTERRQRMLACLNELQLDFRLFNAIDGKNLNQTYLDELGIHFMPGWKDPWGERPMTFGEVGCFLSHYFIWLKMIAEDLETVLVLEDDIDFEPDFKENIHQTLEEVRSVDQEWDIVYVGRKALNPELENIIEGTNNLVKPNYSYWTLGYLISSRGAKKLLAARPFDKLLPVDEYIPIMFNKHPEDDWVKFFTNRNLNAYSASPLLLYPTHYVGDEGWFSDTEPPIEVLEQIRLRKVKEEEERERQKKKTVSTMKTEL